MNTQTCESCGSDEETVWRVRRVYVTPPDPIFPDITETRETVLDEIEQWCFACLASYPHEPVED